jgi:hypothetical protein
MEKWGAKAAFINAVMKREDEIYIKQPAGHEIPGTEGMVCKLIKALYGLHQSAAAWQDHLNVYFKKAGFRPYHKDQSVYYCWTEDRQGFCIVGTHVDDMLPVYNEKGRGLRDHLWETLTKGMVLTNDGNVDWMLKTRVQHDAEQGVTKISQGAYTEEVLKRFGCWDGVKVAKTPAFLSGEGGDMEEEDFPKTEMEKKEMEDKYPFQQAIGCLWWLVSISRCDILVATQKAAKYISRPSEKLWRWILRIFQYLRGTVQQGLVYTRPDMEMVTEGQLRFVPRNGTLTGAADSSFADCEGKRTTLGICVKAMGNLMDYQTKTSTRVLLSSTEAECMALVLFWKQQTWLKHLMEEMLLFDLGKPTLVKEDNTSAQALAGKGPSKRSRYFDMDFYLMKEEVEKGNMEIQRIDTESNEADFFTKSLPSPAFVKHRDSLMGSEKLQNFFVKGYGL